MRDFILFFVVLLCCHQRGRVCKRHLLQQQKAQKHQRVLGDVPDECQKHKNENVEDNDKKGGGDRESCCFPLKAKLVEIEVIHDVLNEPRRAFND